RLESRLRAARQSARTGAARVGRGQLDDGGDRRRDIVRQDADRPAATCHPGLHVLLDRLRRPGRHGRVPRRSLWPRPPAQPGAGETRPVRAIGAGAPPGGRAREELSMIRNFRDHSANERTFLAWVRTAIAVMAFGFIVEKFDLFLELASPSLVGRTLSLPGQG